MLSAFDSPTGIPYRFVNLKSCQIQSPETNPAEVGTLLDEFGTLSKLTSKTVFYDKAKCALVEIFKRRSPIGLVGQGINVETGKWTDPNSHIGGEIDSYYEYLLKGWLLFGDRDCQGIWLESISTINKYLADEDESALWYAETDMYSGVHTATSFGALHAFSRQYSLYQATLSERNACRLLVSRCGWNTGSSPNACTIERWRLKTPHISYDLK